MNNKNNGGLIIFCATLILCLILYINAFHKERIEKQVIKAKFEQHLKDDSLKNNLCNKINN